jgi:hypothetical protein
LEALIALAHLGGGNLRGDARPDGLILNMPDPTISYVTVDDTKVTYTLPVPAG